MERGPSGNKLLVSTVGDERVEVFVPAPLPPRPPLTPTTDLREKLDQALVALGRLDSVSSLLPDTHLFLYTYVRKEAVLSSQIEGTQSSLSDLLLFELEEAPGVPVDDLVEVANYVAALDHGLRRIRGGFPLSNRLIREMHGLLLQSGRGARREPGEFRTSQNWIGGTRPGNAAFVPPPPERVADLMGDLERFLNDQPLRTPIAEKAALAHVQFETIHPFLDGNGRIGRLLITLLLTVEGVLHEPLLYLSLYLKQHRGRYYELLDVVRREGDWEAWLDFFADAIVTTARGAVATASTLAELFQNDRQRIQTLGRAAGSALRVHHELQRRPMATGPRLRERTRLTLPTVGKALEGLAGLDIVREITGRRRGRIFVYDRYLALLNEGTET